MEIKSEDIVAIITSNGSVFVGQKSNEWFDTVIESPNVVRLDFPFRFVIDQGSGHIKIAAPLLKEEWIVIDTSGAIQTQVNKQIEEVYRRYCEQEFGTGIILPEEKKVIL